MKSGDCYQCSMELYLYLTRASETEGFSLRRKCRSCSDIQMLLSTEELQDAVDKALASRGK